MRRLVILSCIILGTALPAVATAGNEKKIEKVNSCCQKCLDKISGGYSSDSNASFPACQGLDGEKLSKCVDKVQKKLRSCGTKCQSKLPEGASAPDACGKT